MSDRIIGTDRCFNEAISSGFIIAHDHESDVFVHFRFNGVEGYRTLKEAHAVEFTLVEGPKGPQAEDVANI